jgi:polysaccharide chain length determinant protein (PEP-CTERM system associated)
MKTSPALDLKKILNVLYVRKGMILVIALVIFTLTAYVAMSLPNIYRSSILILVSPQKLPASYVAPTVTTTVEQRVRAVSEEILSRTTLERVVREFDLYPPQVGSDNMDARLARLGKNIQIDVRNNDTFRLSFDHESPERAMQVAARLGSIFIDANLEVREQQAIGTTTFISAEADRLRKDLELKEVHVNKFKADFRNELPDQLDANLRTLEQFRAEQQSNMVRLTSLQERKANLEKQLVEIRFVLPDARLSKDPEGRQIVPSWQQLEIRRQELEDFLTRYSDKHPDIIRLRNEVKSLEAESRVRQSKAQGSPSLVVPAPVGNPLQDTIVKQIADLNVEINALRATNETLRTQIASYQIRVDNTSARANELAKISRTYDVTLKKYQDLLAKSFDSQLSQNMEKQQQGERFRLVDPAHKPDTPVRPNRPVILLLGLLAGIGAGVALVVFLDNMDTSFKRSEDLDGYLSVPLLASIPAVSTRGSVLEQRRMQRMLVLASLGVLTVGFLLIRFLGSFLAVL